MKNSQNTLWVAGAGVLSLLLVVATYLLVIAPQRSSAADLADQRVSVQESNAQLAQQTEVLKSQFATLADKRRELADIEATLPARADVPDLLRQFQTFAEGAGLTVTQVSPGAAAPFGTTSGDATATVPNPSGIVEIPVTVVVSGTFPQVELYTKSLQADMVRHLLVKGVTVTADQSSTQKDVVTGTITGSVFVLGDTTGSTPAAVTPTGAPTSTGSTPSSSTTTSTDTAAVS